MNNSFDCSKLYSRFGTAESDTGNDCMDIRPHYNSIPTLHLYWKIVVMPHVPSDASVSDSVPPNLLYCRFGTAVIWHWAWLHAYKASLPFNTNFQLVLKDSSDASCAQWCLSVRFGGAESAVLQIRCCQIWHWELLHAYKASLQSNTNFKCLSKCHNWASCAQRCLSAESDTGHHAEMPQPQCQIQQRWIWHWDVSIYIPSSTITF